MVSGLGTTAAAWLSAALVRARTADPDRLPVRVVTTGLSFEPGPLPEVCAAAYRTLTEQVSVVDDPVKGRLTGWPHSLGESAQQTAPVRPTSVGTAYGLHTMLDLGMPEGRLRTGELVETLWRLRLPGGGWSARSQGAEARPEVTALVLGALARAGAAPERLAEEVVRCESDFTPERGRTGAELTHVVTTVPRGLLRAAPGSSTLPALRDALIGGTINDPRRLHRRCWGYRLAPFHGSPSPLHTAQTVVALDRTARVLGEGGNARAAREDGLEEAWRERLDGELPEQELVPAARAVIAELGAPERPLELAAELASGEGEPEDRARLSYRHVLGFGKLLPEPTGPARLRLTQMAEYTAGSTYALPAHTPHRARCDTPEPTVTLFLETGSERPCHTDVFTAAGPHPGAVPKVPLDVADYLAELNSLAELLRSS